eukprot:CAMPEP_0114656656 /NCGR_PEP_ID=MMETSP0191-20121206/12687_1 /TAXON_ID=126664 /ORGANISM="Sorites sp." /LENGTH=36 /DNA_ID= /DNA_START= /DNA_END= /DNA_ORIENTATION=
MSDESNDDYNDLMDEMMNIQMENRNRNDIPIQMDSD